MQAFTVPDAQVDVGHAAYKSFIKGKPGMGDYSVPQTFGWGLDPECKERMLKLMDEAKQQYGEEDLSIAPTFHQERAEKKNDPVEHPNHYVMPDGSETLSITRWLNNNGGQAVGYITRVCRIDGVVKGNAVEDLEKAIFLLRDEVDRLKSLEAKDA